MELRQRLNERLAQHIETLIQKHGDTYAYVKEYILTGAKQVRPLMFLESLQIWGGHIDDHTLDVACALELLHSFFLIHDDIMDGDDLRRDKPTLHAAFLQGGMQDGMGRAIVWGDLLYTEVFRLLLSYPDPKIAQLLLQLTVDVGTVTAEGQIQEADRSLMPDMAHLLAYYEKKTAAYSLFMPLQAAAIVAQKGATEEDLRKLSSHAGIAYQLYDDYTELLGEKKRRTGNRCGDLMRLKATPLLLRVLPDLSPDLRAVVEAKFAQGGELTLQEEENVRQTMDHQGTLVDTAALIHKHATAALASMQELGLENLSSLQAILKGYLTTTMVQN